MKYVYLCIASAGLLSSCAAVNSDPGSGQILRVSLQSGSQNMGAIAEAILVARGEETDINFVIGGVPPGTSRPLQLLTFIYPGSCAKLGPQPAYAMNSNVHATIAAAGWRLGKTIPVALDKLRSSNHAILVRTTPADRSLDIFCGNVE